MIDDVVTYKKYVYVNNERMLPGTNKIQKKIDHDPVYMTTSFSSLFQKGENKKSKTKWSEAWWVSKDVHQ